MKKIVVLGGGTAGWVTALFVQRYWPQVKIIVVEDPKRPPIIAGESGNTLFTDFLRRINIDKDDFVKSTNATPKLGGRFFDWDGVGTEFLHCMQTDHSPWLENWGEYIEEKNNNNLNLHMLGMILSSERTRANYLKTVVANDVPLEYMFHSGEFIRQNKVPVGATVKLPCNPMWHFESRAAALWFKSIGLERNLEVEYGEFISAKQNEYGDITSILLDTGKELEADWFFDCSGFSRLLIGKILNVQQINLEHVFPARSVVAWWDAPEPTLTTNAYAMKYGWSWNINLRHRSGNGYIFDPNLITLDQAINEASIRFNKKIDPVANFTYTPGIFKKSWEKNCIAVGLSSGFLEPLEANGVAVIIEAMYSLLDYWDPEDKENEYEFRVNRFNERMYQTYDDIKDFLALHYRGHRSDTEFWLQHKDVSRIPDSLKAKLEFWKRFYETGDPEPQFMGYSPAAWLMVLQGLNIFDTSKLKQMPEIKLGIGLKILENSKSFYRQLVDPFWTLEQWLQKTA